MSYQDPEEIPECPPIVRRPLRKFVVFYPSSMTAMGYDNEEQAEAELARVHREGLCPAYLWEWQSAGPGMVWAYLPRKRK